MPRDRRGSKFRAPGQPGRGWGKTWILLSIAYFVIGWVYKNNCFSAFWEWIRSAWQAIAQYYIVLWALGGLCLLLGFVVQLEKWSRIRPKPLIWWEKAGNAPMGQPILILVFGFLALIFTGIVCAFPPVNSILLTVGGRLGWESNKSGPFLRDVFIAMGALIAVAFAYWRAKQNDEKNRIDHDRLVAETFRQAVQMLAAMVDGRPALEQRIGAIETLRQIVIQEYKSQSHETRNFPGHYNTAITPILTEYILQNAQGTAVSVGSSEGDFISNVRRVGPDVRKAFAVLWDIIYPGDNPYQQRPMGSLDFFQADFDGLMLTEVFETPAHLRPDDDMTGHNNKSAWLPLPLNLNNAHLQGTYLVGAQLQGSSLYGALLQGAKLDNAQLQRATLTSSQLQGATVTGANLEDARFDCANLQAVDLEHAIIKNTNFFAASVDLTHWGHDENWDCTKFVNFSKKRVTGDQLGPRLLRDWEYADNPEEMYALIGNYLRMLCEDTELHVSARKMIQTRLNEMGES